MSSWLSARIIIIVATLFVLVQLTRRDSFDIAVRHDIVACAVLLVLYILAFLLPLWQTFGFLRVLGALVSVVAAWIAVALALISDATPLAPDESALHHNWPMVAFCIAAAVAFFLFFDSTSKGFRLRNEIRAMRGLR